MNSKLTKYAYYVGIVYFICMALAHYLGTKVPLLFVYYDTPYYAYQDKVISFAVCAYIGLFYAASKHRDVSVIAIVVMGLTVAGLASINTSDTLLSLLREEQSVLPYWLQTGFIASFFFVLLGLYFYDGKNE